MARPPAAHGTRRRYRKGCRCSDCTEANRVECARYRHRYKERRGKGYRPPSRPTLGAKCLGCGESVRGAYRKEAPWHQACREQSERAERRRQMARHRLAVAAEGSAGWGIITTGPCGWCGTLFAVRANVPAGFCSRQCRVSDRAKRRGKFKIRPAERLAIYERDNWTCQLCHGPVDPSLPPLDDWAASLDHVECQAWALIPDHSPGNLRLAHRWCNSVRGDETHYAATDLAA